MTVGREPAAVADLTGDPLLDLAVELLDADDATVAALMSSDADLVEAALSHPGLLDAVWGRLRQAWLSVARPGEQVVDVAADWFLWFYMAGRGTGKTRSGGEQVSEWCRTDPGCRVALVGERLKDVRGTMVEGESGLLRVLPPAVVERWNRTTCEMRLVNGCLLQGYSSESPGDLRGPQHHYAWVDEPAKFSDAHLGDRVDTTWNNLLLGLRLGARPRAVITGTPKRVQLIRELVAREGRGLIRTTGSTYDNLGNLAPSFRDEILASYEGTFVGGQELLGQLLEEVEGALWTRASIDDHRVTVDAMPPLTRVGVAVDPSFSGGVDADECGIVAVGVDRARHGYVLADESARVSPDQWARKAIALFDEIEADVLIWEQNMASGMVEQTIKAAAFALHAEGLRASSYVPMRPVRAAVGKRPRAEPIAALYEQGRMHHVVDPDRPGQFVRLEDQLTSWTPEDRYSPDRLDALVWASWGIVLGGVGPGSLSAARRTALARIT